jgi:hypothetical protein
VTGVASVVVGAAGWDGTGTGEVVGACDGLVGAGTGGDTVDCGVDTAGTVAVDGSAAWVGGAGAGLSVVAGAAVPPDELGSVTPRPLAGGIDGVDVVGSPAAGPA